MDIKFSARYVLITFEKGELFEGLSIRMGGEPLTDAYDASLSTMEWIEDHKTFPVDDFVKQKVKELIEKDNVKHSYKVIFMEDRNV